MTGGTAGASSLASGKGHRDENFPVASRLIRARHRAPILAFYRFARAADDVADNAGASEETKLALLDEMRASLAGESDAAPEAVALRGVCAARGLSVQHGLELLEAFRRDVTKHRYVDWDDLMDYCRYSAMPVGRFVLDVHGEDTHIWPACDALCAALQVINHLQDCGKDFCSLDRVYIPEPMLASEGLCPSALGKARAAPALLRIVATLARRNAGLLERARPLASQLRDVRLGLEVSVIQRLAEDLNARLLTRDPLSARVHHTKAEALRLAITASLRFLAGGRRASPMIAAVRS